MPKMDPKEADVQGRREFLSERGKHFLKPGRLCEHLTGKLRIEPEMSRKGKLGLITCGAPIAEGRSGTWKVSMDVKSTDEDRGMKGWALYSIRRARRWLEKSSSS